MKNALERRHTLIALSLLLLCGLLTSCSYFRWGERSPDEIRSMPSEQQTNSGTLFRSELDR